MSQVRVTETSLETIADAIRAKLGVQTTYRPSEMAAAIQSIPTYPEPSGTIQITQNGTFNVKDYASAEVDVSGGGGAVVQPLSVTQNGTYTPPSGVDGYAPVTVNVSGGGSLIANWDFKTSLTDSVNGLTATLYNATRDENGVELAFLSAYINFSSAVFAGLRTFEIDVGSMSFQGSGHHRFFMVDSSNGFIYRNTGKWSFYSGTWATDSDISDYDFFANSTVKIYVDENCYWHIYKNGTLVYEPNVPRAPANSCIIGASNNSLYQAVIEGLRVY